MCARLCALRWGGLEVVCAMTHRLLRAAGCSIRRQLVFTLELLHCQGWENGRRWWKAWQ